MGIIYRGTIAWAYVFSFPAGVIWGKIRNKEITPEKKKVVCILSFAFSALVVAYRYGIGTVFYITCGSGNYNFL